MSNGTSQWLDEFRERNGRPLRVLHIGNIANNAYRNALIQRRIGIEADVVCFDYYHVMGCPEWEETDLRGEYDAFLPDWWTIDAGKWRRPAWFVQGPLEPCLAYLRAVRSGSARGVLKARLTLIQSYATLLDSGSASANARLRDVMAPCNRSTTERLAPEVREGRTSGLSRIIASAHGSAERAFEKFSSRQWRASLAEQTVSGLLDPALRLSLAKNSLHWDDRFKLAVYAGIRELLGRTHKPVRRPAPPGYWNPDPSTLGPVRLISRYLAGTALWLGLQGPAAAAKRRDHRAVSVSSKPIVALAPDAEIDRLAGCFHSANADVSTDQCNKDLGEVRAAAAKWRDILAHYDVVQGYALDAALPLFAGHPNCVAYEHGTIRDIPFEASSRGRLCRFTYANVARALITNTDVLPSADRIPIDRSRRVFLPHAFDDSRLKTFRQDNEHLKPSGGTVQLFSPTRHHWCTPDRSLNKGNDILLRGVAEAARSGVKVRIKLVEWGQHVGESKRLINDLQIADLVSWVPIMNRTQLWSACVTSHAIADQFALPALGGVGYESLTLGTRLITNIDVPALAVFFGEFPPVLMAATPTEVAERIRELAEDPEDHAGRGSAGAAWAARYHSTDLILDLQVAAYREILGVKRPIETAGAAF